MAPKQIPYSTIVRLTQYLRVVEKLNDLGISGISSAELCEETRINSFLVRKDLSYFGEFGTRGVGYDIPSLRLELEKILGLTEAHRTVIVGAGNLGTALVHYDGFKEKGFKIVAVFDSDPSKIDKKIGDFVIESVFMLEEYLNTNKDVTIGIIAVPASGAQFIANLLIASGIKGILCFAPIQLMVPDDVVYSAVDLTTYLEIISYYITNPDARRTGDMHY
ncbi:redox-sensing transcriptional repressor Rex [bacterium]|nr:redox-sensing transcriptional repressor Rex [bacterium]